MTYEKVNVSLVLSNLTVLRDSKRLKLCNDPRMVYRVDAYSRAIHRIESMVKEGNHFTQFDNFKRNRYRDEVAGSSIMKIIEHVARTDSDYPEVSEILTQAANRLISQETSLKQKDTITCPVLDVHNHPVSLCWWSRFLNRFRLFKSPSDLDCWLNE